MHYSGFALHVNLEDANQLTAASATQSRRKGPALSGQHPLVQLEVAAHEICHNEVNCCQSELYFYVAAEVAPFSTETI